MSDTRQREELARDIFIADNSHAPVADMLDEWRRRPLIHRSYAYNIAEGLIAKGYSKPRTITTVEELGALFEGAFGTDADGLLWKIDGGRCAWINIDEGADEEYRDDEIKLPFTLLSPEAEITR